MIDEGFACTPAATGACTTSCGTTGTQTCDGTCAWGSCVAPVEACNTIDDDCDGMVDEGCGACVACPGATAVTAPGGRYTQPLGTSLHTGTCGGAGPEHTLTFTIASASDVFIATHGATVNTVLYVRSCGCSGTEVACNDDADGQTTSMLRLTNLAAGTYQVFVDSAAGSSGSVPVDIYISAPGTQSDRCGNPTFIPAGATTLTGNTCAFTNDYTVAMDAGCPYSGTGAATDRVYYFYLPTSRSVTVSGCTTGTSFDTTFYVRSVCSDGALANQLACNDDSCSGSTTSCTAGLRSSITQTLGPGLHYLFIDGYQSGASSCPCGAFAPTLTGF
jgi:hypothetical protein